jgi:hypothetical protein
VVKSMGKDVIFSDVALFPTAHIRARLAAIAAGPEALQAPLPALWAPVTRPRGAPGVVVRDDSGPKRGYTKESAWA